MGHGDFQVLVFAPSTVQEMADLTYQAFDMADEYRMPAMILADGMLGQMMEPVVLPERAWSSCQRSLGPPPVTRASASTTSWTRST